MFSLARSEFDEVADQLAAAGVPLKADRDKAWRDFAGWRVNYDAVLVGHDWGGGHVLTAVMHRPELVRFALEAGLLRPAPEPLAAPVEDTSTSEPVAAESAPAVDATDADGNDSTNSAKL